MRQFIARVLGSLALGALLAVGVGAVASSADAAPAGHISTRAHAQPMDWWLG